jgi:predicted ATP-dependent serine protease
MKTTIKILNEITFDPKRYIPYQSNTALDTIFSKKGGLAPGTNYMIAGPPGVAKSTVSLKYAASLQEKNYKVLCINSEMGIQDMIPFHQLNPEIGNIPILYTQDILYNDESIKDSIKRIINEGYHIIIIDSWAELIETIKTQSNENTAKVEQWLMSLLHSNNEGKNSSKVYSSFLLIQQVTKGGVFVGNNRIKHLITGMLELNFDQDEQWRYIKVTKNRRGPVNKRLYYIFDKDGNLIYDTKRNCPYIKSKELNQIEEKSLKQDKNEFDNWARDTKQHTIESLNHKSTF